MIRPCFFCTHHPTILFHVVISESGNVSEDLGTDVPIMFRWSKVSTDEIGYCFPTRTRLYTISLRQPKCYALLAHVVSETPMSYDIYPHIFMSIHVIPITKI